ncbi:MAG TPA: arylsulfotransferase family protein, partial [Pirellulales bacterium]|nr:arylsulfotransferase family protein [Pirellulales bacterium]
PPRRKFLAPCLAIVGIASLSYLLGAAVVFFELPSSAILQKAFVGARAWREQTHDPRPDAKGQLTPFEPGKIDKPEKTFDGFTLCSGFTRSGTGSQAFLVNMRREVVHRWAKAFSEVWPEAAHVRGRANDASMCFFSCHLFSNGDLLVVFHGQTDRHPPNGCGLVKLNKDSNVVWSYPANVHHDVDVGEDGTIYAIQSELVDLAPPGKGSLPTPCLLDCLVLLSPNGEPLRKPISILEAFQNSPYSAFLSPLGRFDRQDELAGDLDLLGLDPDGRAWDRLHTNCVRVLSAQLAPKFPGFKAGQVLISVRHLDAIAVLDPQTGAIVWAACGPWRAQHDAQFLENGHLLVFDNRGLSRRSQVLEYDPQTQAFPWTYSGSDDAPFFTSDRGMSQRLPNGNTLIVVTDGGEIIEVTADKEVVWTCSTNCFVTTGRRYSGDQLHFLPEGEPARP